MEPAILGLVLDSSVLIAAERRKQTPAQIIEDVVKKVGAVPIILSSLTVAEIGHGIYRANTPEIRERRRAFLDELKATHSHPSDHRCQGGNHRSCRWRASR